MKLNYYHKLISVLALHLLITLSNAQCNVDSLVKSGQYLTAYEYLLSIDKQNKKPDCVLAKCDLALNYYYNSHYHRNFAFVNLREGEKLEILRTKAYGLETPYKLVIDSVLLQLKNEFPSSYKIDKLLGDYYNRVYYDFGDRWGEKAEVLLEKSNSYYLQAFENGVFDYYSLYSLGYYQSIMENYFQAQQWFLKSLDLNSNEPLTNYSLAVTYLFDGIPQSGIPYSIKAYELYKDSLKKADAARICGILYTKTDNPEKAHEYFVNANELWPGYRPNQLYLLSSFLLLNKDAEAGDLSMELLLQDPYSPELPDEFIELYMKNEKSEVLISVFYEVIDEMVTDFEGRGNMYFHLGKLLYKNGNKNKAKRIIKKSRKEFMEVFENDHQVFGVIDQMLIRM